jgi:uncharacterized protein YqgV (UPF0045/DUF77 family)
MDINEITHLRDIVRAIKQRQLDESTAARPWITIVDISVSELLELIRSGQTADSRQYSTMEFDTEEEARQYAYMAALAGYSTRVRLQAVGQLKRV